MRHIDYIAKDVVVEVKGFFDDEGVSFKVYDHEVRELSGKLNRIYHKYYILKLFNFFIGDTLKLASGVFDLKRNLKQLRRKKMSKEKLSMSVHLKLEDKKRLRSPQDSVFTVLKDLVYSLGKIQDEKVAIDKGN